VFVSAYKSTSYANKVVGQAIFTKCYLGHLCKKVGKYCTWCLIRKLANWNDARRKLVITPVWRAVMHAS